MVEKDDRLVDQKCVSAGKDTPVLKRDEILLLIPEIHEDWQVHDENRLERTFKTDDFKSALELTQKIGNLAEKENHHPDIFLSWGKVKVHLTTHKIGGLSKNDFILAAKIDKL